MENKDEICCGCFDEECDFCNIECCCQTYECTNNCKKDGEVLPLMSSSETYRKTMSRLYKKNEGFYKNFQY